MADAKFDVTPEKQASFPRFMYQQVTEKPQPIKDVDLGGRTALVTGSNSAVGLETARHCSCSSSASRSRSWPCGLKGKDKDAVEVWKLDVSSNDSVAALADRAAKTLERLDVAVLNAGFCPAKRVVNPATGHGEIIHVNYISTALLAVLLLPLASRMQPNQPQPTRITLTLSGVACWARLPVGKDLPIPSEIADNTNDRMFVSKLLGHFFVRALASKVPPPVAFIDAASPGAIHDSQFNRDIDNTPPGAVIKAILRRVGNSSAIGARLLTDAAVNHGEDVHGQFRSFGKTVPKTFLKLLQLIK